jgi:transportin-3
MASAEVVSPEVVLQAMATMRSGNASQKKAAMDYLQRFQKSVCLHDATRLRAGLLQLLDISDLLFQQKEAWPITLGILENSSDGEAQVFAATTLKGKVRLLFTDGHYLRWRHEERPDTDECDGNS